MIFVFFIFFSFDHFFDFTYHIVVLFLNFVIIFFDVLCFRYNFIIHLFNHIVDFIVYSINNKFICENVVKNRRFQNFQIQNICFF